MPAGPIPQKVLAEQQRRQFTRALQLAPPPANLEAATTLHDRARVQYRGRWYDVDPVPAREGLRLQALDFEIRQLDLHEPGEDVMRQSLRVLDAMLATFARLVRQPWWRRLLRRPANPFLDAEIGEIRALRDFFCSARTKSPVRAVVSVRAPAWVQSTWPISLPPLRVGIHAGWRQTAIPVATGTFNSDSPGWLTTLSDRVESHAR